MQNDKVKAENLTASPRSPVIPQIKETKKAPKDKDAKKAAEKLKNIMSEPDKTEPDESDPAKKPDKTEKAKEPKDATLLVKINAYGFIGLRKPVLEALDWHKGLALKLEKNADGSVTARKA